MCELLIVHLSCCCPRRDTAACHHFIETQNHAKTSDQPALAPNGWLDRQVGEMPKKPDWQPALQTLLSCEAAGESAMVGTHATCSRELEDEASRDARAFERVPGGKRREEDKKFAGGPEGARGLISQPLARGE